MLERSMLKTRWLTALTAAAALTSLATPAQAADLRLSATSSLGLSCGVAGARAGVQEGRFGVYGEGAYCRSGVEGEAGSAAFGLGATFDLFSTNGLTGYVVAGANLQDGNPVVYGGLGARYGLELFPVEGFAEVGVQRLSTDLLVIPGPRVTVGLTYRTFVGPLSSLVAAPAAATGEGAAGSGEGAPAQCSVSPEEDRAAARSAASRAATRALSAAAGSYSAGFSSFTYQVNISSVTINGNTAVATGSITINLVSRGSGTRSSDTYPGTVTLVRDGCGWRATGYTRG